MADQKYALKCGNLYFPVVVYEIDIIFPHLSQKMIRYFSAIVHKSGVILWLPI